MSLRTRELGVRLAFGATREDILRLVVCHGIRLTLGGLGIGLVSALALTRFVSSILYGVAATGPITLTTVLVFIIMISVLGCYFPAQRATRLDPIAVLRYE